MSQTTEFFERSQQALVDVVETFRPVLLSKTGHVEEKIKSDETPVTELDLSIETALKDKLRVLDPGIGFEGEEHGKEGNQAKRWLLDPIDGTESFIRGMGSFRTLVTLIDDEKPVFAFMHDYAKNETYIADSESPTTCNGELVKLSERPLKRAWLEFTADQKSAEALKILPALRKHARGVRVTGDFTNVLQGRLEGHLFYRATGSVWDFAPWALLIGQAGGKVANIGDDKYDYRNGSFLAAGPHIFDDLMEIIVTAVNEDD